MTVGSYSRNCLELVKGQVRTSNETDEGRITEKRKIIETETISELVISLLEFAVMEIELLVGSSFCNDDIYIRREPEIDLNLFPMRINDVEGCRLIEESVVRRGRQKYGRRQVFLSSFIAFIEYM